MLNDFFKQTFPMIEGAKKAKRKPNLFFLILFGFLLLAFGFLLNYLFLAVYLSLKASTSTLPQTLLLSKSFQLSSLLSPDESNIVSLLMTGFTLVLFLMFCRYYEKRYFPSMGFVRKKKFSSYAIGLGIGAIMMVSVIGLLLATTSISFKQVTTSAIPIIIVTFGAYMIQGASEEVMLRGYLMTSIAARKNNVLLAVLINSVLFALLHLGNPNLGPISFINILLFGIFMSLYVLKTNNLWGACAIHTMWNFLMGSLFGLSVSGGVIVSSIFKFNINKDLWFLNGGAFGPEGGLIVTVIILIALYGMYHWIQKDLKKEQA